ncbi:MAG: hypothetical protein AAF449_20345 [Myxococcota bacterium]
MTATRWHLTGLVLITTLGCPDPVGNKLTAGPEALSNPAVGSKALNAPTDIPSASADPKDRRYIRIRDLLRRGSDDPTRATQLYDLVHPVCTNPAEQADFLNVAKWSVSFSDDDNRRTAVLAIDTLEYVATACFRTDAAGTLTLLEKAESFLPAEPRLAALRARLHAAAGDLDRALTAAQTASKNGSIHALALIANIQARIARREHAGYTPGMFEAAIQTVSATPAADWRAIDLAAILATKSRLLWERAAWEEGAKAQKTLAEADALFERLSVPPFLKQMRLRAADNLCYDAVVTQGDIEACRKAAEKWQILGAGVVAGLPLEPQKFDVVRHQRIEQARATWQSLPKGSAVWFVARGDEAELLEWTRPTARMLRALLRPDLRFVAVDRTREARASALLDRLLVLAGVKADFVLRVGHEPLAMPCIAAIAARRRVPASCPLSKADIERLEDYQPYGSALLVGRDLDAELDDLALYELDATLLSFRLSRRKKPTHAWLKSVSDTFLLAP